MRQISVQDNVSCIIQNHTGIFRSKVFVSVFQSEQKVFVEIFVLMRILFVTVILTIAQLIENLPNSLKVETRSDRYLYIPLLDIYILKAIKYKLD